MRDLVAYADARGITLVPELETPGHSQAMARSMPDVFGGPKIMNITNDEMYKALDTLVGEMCDVFKSSPYFHIGCDEMYFFELEEQQQTSNYLQQKGIKNLDEVFVQHVQRMNEMVRKRGKMTLAWEGVAVPSEGRAFALPDPLKSQIIPMCWFPWPTAEGLQKQGFTTITVPWGRGESLQDWNIYFCNGVKIDPANGKVLGGAVTMWQMSAAAVVSDFLGGNLNGSSTEGYILSLGDHMEGAWSPLAKVDAVENNKRLVATRAILASLLLPVRITGNPIAYRGWPVIGSQHFGSDVDVSISTTRGKDAGEIRYTIDGSEPTSQSPVYSEALSVQATTTFHAALFSNGKQVGAVARATFARLDDEGAIGQWLVAGPYTSEGKKAAELFDQAFEPETSGAADWQPISSAVVKFSDIAGIGGNDRVAYMRSQIFSLAAQKAKLLVGSDDGAKVFLNGKMVHSVNVARPSFHADTIDVTLQEGWNTLLVKVTNGDGGWEAWAKIRNANGERLESVRIKAE